jgi:tRNA-2-methylthio-N6-dimethylallyladenosine synthase
MKRLYTIEEYRDMMNRIREIIPDCAVSSDFIVGFCGETEESFERSLSAVREFRFKNSFIFKYSPRPGTRAYELYPDDVPEDVKKRRNNELLAAQTEISEEDNADFIGRRVEVLVEGLSKAAQKRIARGEGGETEQQPSLPGWHAGADIGEGETHHEHGEPLLQLNGAAASSSNGESGRVQLVGRTKCDRIVVFDGNPRLAGTLAAVVIEDVTPTTLLGSIITQHVQPGSHELLPILQ